jgi:predicted ester cyclase
MGDDTDEKSTTLRCFEELWATGHLRVADEILHPDYRGHAPGFRAMHGRAALKDLVRRYHRGFPGLELAVVGQIAEGDRVVTEFTLTGVHTGRWMGVPATGRTIRLGGLAFSRFSPFSEGGQIVEQWYEWERRLLLEQLGLLPALPDSQGERP